METVEVLVRIPKEVYEVIQQTAIISGRRSGRTVEFALWNGVKNGTVLPKRHGRLKDVDELLKYNCVDVWTDYGLQTNISVLSVDTAPTIIEATKEE